MDGSIETKDILCTIQANGIIRRRYDMSYIARLDPKIHFPSLCDIPKDYTEEELQEAIKQESELCALICNNLGFRYNTNQISVAGVEGAFEDCAEQIRARGKE